MTGFFIILCILLIIISAITFYSLDTKLRENKRQYRLLNNQYNALKATNSPTIEAFKKIKIKYVNPSFSSGITKENTLIYFTPLDKNKIVKKLTYAEDIPILEECVIANEIWLYVEIESGDKINCRGWIHKKDFSFLKDKIQII